MCSSPVLPAVPRELRAQMCSSPWAHVDERLIHVETVDGIVTVGDVP